MKESTYKRVGDTHMVSRTLGYFPAIRLSPSGSGERYKGKKDFMGYLIVEVDDKGDEKIEEGKNAFVSQVTVLSIMKERVEAQKKKEKEELEDSIENLPYKNIINLTPIIQEEITRASEMFGFKTTDDLTVEVTLEENLELVVRIGLA